MSEDKPLFTAIPNFVLDVWLPLLRGAEIPVLMYILRETIGYHVSFVRLSNVDIQNGTGLSEKAIRLAVKSLESVFIIAVKRGDGGHTRTAYKPILDNSNTLNLLKSRVVNNTTLDDSGGQNIPPEQRGKIYHPSTVNNTTLDDSGGQNIPPYIQDKQKEEKEKDKEIPPIPQKGEVINKSKVFIPPTLEESVEFFLAENSTATDAKEFWLWYDAADWMRSGKKMVRWKSAAAGWITRNANKYAKSRSSPTLEPGVSALAAGANRHAEIIRAIRAKTGGSP